MLGLNPCPSVVNFYFATGIIARDNRVVTSDWEKLRAIVSAEVEETLAALPKPLRQRAGQLPVTFERVPNAGLQADGIEPDTLGLFTGPEYAEEGNVPMPPQIILFLENLRDLADGEEKVFREEVQTTFLHELGHYLGLYHFEHVIALFSVAVAFACSTSQG
ncbi:MAG: metallopeptidase family protein [Verrucomicrobiia bacterium]